MTDQIYRAWLSVSLIDNFSMDYGDENMKKSAHALPCGYWRLDYPITGKRCSCSLASLHTLTGHWKLDSGAVAAIFSHAHSTTGVTVGCQALPHLQDTWKLTLHYWPRHWAKQTPCCSRHSRHGDRLAHVQEAQLSHCLCHWIFR